MNTDEIMKLVKKYGNNRNNEHPISEDYYFSEIRSAIDALVKENERLKRDFEMAKGYMPTQEESL